MLFKNRIEAGQKLAEKLKKFKSRKDVIVLGIPRGGVEVAFGIAKSLKVNLSVVVTKKIGHPYESEFAIGAVSPGSYFVDEAYTNGEMPEIKNKIAVIVDDGLATGYTMIAAIKYVKSRSPKKIIAAIPVAAQDSYEKVKAIADEVV